MRAARLAACAAGVAAALLAVWIFYLSPFLGVSSPAFARRVSILSLTWWPRYLAPGNQAGAFAALLAVAFFALALFGFESRLRAKLPDPPRWHSGAWWVRGPGPSEALSVCLCLLAYEAVLVTRGRYPSLATWGACFAAALGTAVLWDWQWRRDLERTAADVLVALGTLFCLLGAAAAMKFRPQSLALFAIALPLFGLGLTWSHRLGSSVAWWEHLGLLLLALAVQTFAMSRAGDWRFAMEGDEWGFYQQPRDIVLGLVPEFHPLALAGDRDYVNTNFAHGIIALCMRVAGTSIFGWRLASVLPFALSLAPIYYFLRWLSGSRAATLGACILASSYVLHDFSLIGYNNTHALLPLTLGLGTYAFASARRSMTRYVLTGGAFGLMMLVFAVGRLAIIPMVLLFTFVTWRFRKVLLPACLAAALGFVTMAAPMLFSGSQWRAVVGMTTPVGTAPEGFHKEPLAPAQIADNAVDALFVFLTGGQVTHHFRGPHVDPLTATLMLAGYGFLLANVRRYRVAWVWLLAMLVFSLAAGAHQNYPFIKNTRLFILTPLNAILAGLGGTALVSLLSTSRRIVSISLVAALAVGAAGLNLFHWDRVVAQSAGAMPIDHLVREFEGTAAADGGGMPILLIRNNESDFGLAIARAYGAAVERMAVVGPDEIEQFPGLLEASAKPAMVLVPGNLAEREQVFARVESVWPRAMREEIRHTPSGPVLLYRYLTPAGREELAKPPVQRSSLHGQTTVLEVPRPVCAAVSPAGDVIALSPSTGTAFRFSPDGRSQRLPLGSLQDWASVVPLPDGTMVVNASGPAPLCWYRRDSEPERPIGSADGVDNVRSLVALSGGAMAELTEGGHVLAISADGQVTRLAVAAERGLKPTAIAPGPDGTLWISSADERLVEVSPDGRVLHEQPFPALKPTFAVLPDRTLLYPEIDRQRVVHRDLAGRLRHVFSGFPRPHFVGLAPRNRLMVADAATSSVVIFPPAEALGLTAAQ